MGIDESSFKYVFHKYVFHKYVFTLKLTILYFELYFKVRAHTYNTNLSLLNLTGLGKWSYVPQSISVTQSLKYARLKRSHYLTPTSSINQTEPSVLHSVPDKNCTT